MSTVITLLTLSLIFTIGEASLLIYNSSNGRNYPIAAVIKIINGRNVTLKCKDINNANNEVEWSRKSDNLGFQEKYIRNDDFSRINFVPFRSEDADIYVCKSLKYNVSKTVTITLDETKRRLKRTQYRFEDENYDLSDSKFFLNISDMFGDLFKNKKKFKHVPPPIWIDNKYVNIIQDRPESWPGYDRPSSNIYTTNTASKYIPPRLELEYDELLKRNEYNTIDSPGSISGSNEYGFLYCIGKSTNSKLANFPFVNFLAIIGGLFLFGGIMCMCVRNNPKVRARLDRASSDPPCTHEMCIRHRDRHPLAGCIVANLNPTCRIPTPLVRTDVSGDVTVLSFSDESIESEDRDADENLDIPPSYANSVDDGKCDLPPSYDEAIKIMLPSVYCNEESPSTLH